MNSFALIVGKCVWIPPSGKAALAFIMYLWGASGPGVTVQDYEALIIEQMVIAGETKDQAQDDMQWLNHCAASYVVPDKDKHL